MIDGSHLTRDEWRNLGIATLTTACATAAASLVTWGIEAVKAKVNPPPVAPPQPPPRPASRIRR